MTKAEIYWLAGILEGEGCFLLAESRANGRVYVHPRAELSMADKDVVQRVAVLMQTTVRAQKQKGHYKRMYKTPLYSLRAAALMERLLPIFGIRRRKQITKVLQEWRRLKAKPWGK